jgi:hypothetical protein
VRQTSELLLMVDAVNTARREQTVRIVAEAVTGMPVPVQALADGLLRAVIATLRKPDDARILSIICSVLCASAALGAFVARQAAGRRSP